MPSSYRIKRIFDAGSMYREPSDIYTVFFDAEGEEVSVGVNAKGVRALGWKYWPGKPSAEFGRRAERLVEKEIEEMRRRYQVAR